MKPFAVYLGFCRHLVDGVWDEGTDAYAVYLDLFHPDHYIFRNRSDGSLREKYETG